MNDEPIFNALRRIKGKPLTQFDVDDMKRAIAASMSTTIDPLTVRVSMMPRLKGWAEAQVAPA